MNCRSAERFVIVSLVAFFTFILLMVFSSLLNRNIVTELGSPPLLARPTCRPVDERCYHLITVSSSLKVDYAWIRSMPYDTWYDFLSRCCFRIEILQWRVFTTNLRFDRSKLSIMLTAFLILRSRRISADWTSDFYRATVRFPGSSAYRAFSFRGHTRSLNRLRETRSFCFVCKLP